MSTQQIAYATDFYGWLTNTAKLIRTGVMEEVDFEHIAEELEAMSKSERRELASRLAVLLAQLLKWQFQSEKRSRSWENTIKIQRIDILDLLEESPSLRYEIEHVIETAYRKVCIWTEEETGINQQNFPATCPYPLEALLHEQYFPA
jgi:hypothetical protein